jgi:hypothetical protein
MHTVIWTIKVNEGVSRQDILYCIKASESEFKSVAGLVRVYFGIAPDDKSVLEMSLWQSKAAADQFFTPHWETLAMRRWQAAPMERKDLDTPVVVEAG